MIRFTPCTPQATPCGRISTRRRASIFDGARGTCCLCGHQIDGTHERWIVEHIVPLACGGGDDESNLGPAHEACARVKTSGEATTRARADRARARHTGAKAPPRNPIPGSRSHWARKRKRIDGGVESRDAFEAQRARQEAIL